MLTRQQQGAAVECCGQARNDGVRLLVAAGLKWARRAAEDISSGWLLERNGAVCVGQGVVGHLAVDVAERRLGVDGERLRRVA